MADGAVDESSTSSLLRFLAVGRLVALPDGRWADGKHQLLAFYSAKDDREVKAYKSHCKAIMNKGANKLQPGKRIRLTSDNNDYDLHVLADHAEDDPALTVIFFAVTDPSFGKHHTVSSLLRELKKDFYAATDVRELTATTSTGSLNRQLQQPLARIFSAYNQSKLREVQAKVEKVKSVMKDNVDKALTNVEHLEEMETKAEQFQEHAKQFSKNSTKLKQMFRCRYYKINLLLATLVLAIIGYIIYAIYNKVHG